MSCVVCETSKRRVRLYPKNVHQPWPLALKCDVLCDVSWLYVTPMSYALGGPDPDGTSSVGVCWERDRLGTVESSWTRGVMRQLITYARVALHA